MYLSRQALQRHCVRFYLTLLDAIFQISEREEAFAAIENIPSIKMKGDFMFKWMNSISDLDECRTAKNVSQCTQHDLLLHALKGCSSLVLLHTYITCAHGPSWLGDRYQLGVP